MASRRWGAALAGAAILISAPLAGATQSGAAAPAKGPSTTDLSGVTVTAPEKAGPLVDRATQFVRSHLAESRNEQYARFRDAICVKVVGLPPQFSSFIAKRVVEVANEVHAPVDPSPACAPNVNVIFSATPQAQLNDIAKRRDILFGFHFVADTKTLATFSRPIQSWYLTRTVGTDGVSVLELNQGAMFTQQMAGDAPVSNGGATPAVGRAGSRLGNDMSSELVHALIIADANKVADAKIGAVADYIAVLALSRWQRLERCNAIPTILNLMADGCDGGAPEAATASDVALLSALYAINPRDPGSQQRISIASRMQTELEKAASGDGSR